MDDGYRLCDSLLLRVAPPSILNEFTIIRIKHIVVFRVKAEASVEDQKMIQDVLLALDGTCGVDFLEYECGADLRLLRRDRITPLDPIDILYGRVP